MGVIYIIRHGQASFGADDYDQLSELGVEQARLLGAALSARGVRPDHVVCGKLRRHRQTAESCLRALGATIQWSEDPDWNEYDFTHMIEAHRPDFHDKARMLAEFAATPDPRRAFQDMFAQAMLRWVSGAHDADYAETWQEFRQRVDGAVTRVHETAGRSATTLVFTSGGPISAVVQTLLGLQDAPAAQLNWTLANAALTKLIYSERATYLSTLNEHAHLEHDRRLITYR